MTWSRMDDALNALSAIDRAQEPGGGVAIFRRLEREGDRRGAEDFGGNGTAGLEDGQELAAPRTELEAAPWKLSVGRKSSGFTTGAGAGASRAAVCEARRARRRVAGAGSLSLLDTSDEKGSFLEEPALEVAATGIWQPLPTRLPHPAAIGRYRIIRLLGEGGMGMVYEAEQEQPRRMVALKVIRPGLATPRAAAAVRQESQALGRLQHPGIAQIYEAGTADTGFGPQPYFAMELIRGLLAAGVRRSAAAECPAEAGDDGENLRRSASRAPARTDSPRSETGQHPGG